MGVNTVAFSVVNGLVFKGFAGHPPEHAGRIVTVPGTDEGGNVSLAEYERFADATRGTLTLAAEGRTSMAWRHEGGTEPAWVLFVSSKYFSIVKAPLIAGRLAVERRADETPSAVIGERFWREKLAGAPLAGLTLRLNNVDVSVAGIIAESFTGPSGIYSPDLWVPLEATTLFGLPEGLQKPDARWLFVMGAREDGVTPAQAQGAVAAAAAAMAREWPDTHKDRSARFKTFGEGNSELRALRTAAAVVMSIIGLVLLLACFNVANLLLARAVERERDMGIRSALGASPSRLMRLVVAEGFVLAAGAGVLALVLAGWTRSIVGSFAMPIDVPQHIDMAPDLRVVAFVLVLVFIAGVLPGIWPAITAARVNVSRVLGTQGSSAAGGRPSALRRWLVGAQIAGSTAFLAIAALLIQSYARIAQVDVGFDRQHLLVADLDPGTNGLTGERAAQYVDALVRSARALPDVIDVAVTDRAPFFIGTDKQVAVSRTGAPCEPKACPKYPVYSVAPGYFRTLGMPLVAGRDFDDGSAAAEVIVSEAFARAQWPDGRGLGEVLRAGDAGTPVTVIGITGKTRIRGLDRESPVIFTRMRREDFAAAMTIVVRTSASPSTLVRPMTAAAQAVDPNVSLLSVKPMEQRMAVQLWPYRTMSWMFSICGALAVILATIGLAGVVVHAVSRRTREFGVRISIGATPRDLVMDVIWSSTSLLVPGLVTGLVLAAIGARLAHALFVGVNVLNPLVYAAVAAAQCAIVLVACVGPAIRASRMDPLAALRAE